MTNPDDPRSLAALARIVAEQQEQIDELRHLLEQEQTERAEVGKAYREMTDSRNTHRYENERKDDLIAELRRIIAALKKRLERENR